jgi:hypothetical protein
MIQANRDCLDQALQLLEALDDAQYRSPRGTWSPVGAQLRHVIEHYQCFLAGVEEGRVDYDARRRDPLIEGSRTHAASTIREIIAELGRPSIGPASRPIGVQARCRPDAVESEWTASSVGRELQFLVSHSVHHFALIKLLVAGDGVSLAENFGVAPSTVAYARAHG